MSTPYFGKFEIQNVSFVSLMPTKENQIEFSKPSSFLKPSFLKRWPHKWDLISESGIMTIQKTITFCRN